MDELMKLYEKYGALPSQGSREWVSARTNRFGGSEIAAVIGKNPWVSRKRLIKIKTKGFIPTLPFAWGNLFESEALKYFEFKSNTNFTIHPPIHHFGAIPYEGKELPPNSIAYSPDGITIINKE